ncbi:MAG: hypothetical protein AB7Q27_15360, partial [Acidimicrobiia bacterium]
MGSAVGALVVVVVGAVVVVSRVVVVARVVVACEVVVSWVVVDGAGASAFAWPGAVAAVSDLVSDVVVADTGAVVDVLVVVLVGPSSRRASGEPAGCVAVAGLAAV